MLSRFVSIACIYTCILYQNVKFSYFVYQILSKVILRDEHDTDTKYRFCRYLRVGGKYRYFHQVSLVFDTEPVLFMVACMYENLKKMLIKAKKKQKNAIFFWKYMFD